MFELTIFKNQFDNKTHRKMSFDSWSEFEKLLYGLYTKPGQKGGRNSSALISPAIFNEGDTRSNANTQYWGGWCALDIDDHDLPCNVEDLKNELVKRFGKWTFICYNTASSSTDHPKFRIVFETSRQVTNDEIRHFWFALNTEAAELGDPATKDLARMYYVPAQYPGANSFIFSNSGSPVDVSSLLEAHPYAQKQGKTFFDRLPDELQKAVVAHRMNQLENTNFSWSTYRDCPFVHRSLVAEYMSISGTGWYRKSYGIMLSIASNAIKRGYPITSTEIAELCRQMDADNPSTRERYTNRNYEKEADGAIEYAYRNG